MTSISPVTSDKFDRFNYEAYPSIPESEKNKRIIILDHAKSFGLEFVIMGIYLKILCLKVFQIFIKDYSYKKAILKHRIRHLRQDDNDFEIKRIFGKKMVAPSRNIMKMEVFEREQSSQTIDEKKIGAKKHFSYKGFCAGAAQNFAEQLLPFLLDERADEMVERIAYQYKAGMGVNDVANQHLYENAPAGLSEEQKINKTLKLLQKSGEISQLEKKMIQKFIFWLLNPANKKYPEELQKLFIDIYTDYDSIEKAEFREKYPELKDFIEIIKNINSSYTEYKKDTEQKTAWSSVVKDIIDAQKESMPLINDWLSTFVKKYSKEIDRGWNTKSIHNPKKAN